MSTTNLSPDTRSSMHLDPVVGAASRVSMGKSIGFGTDTDRARRRRVYARLASELALRFADAETPVESTEASLVQRVHEQASRVYDLRDAFDADADLDRADALAIVNAILADSFGEGHSLTLAELESLGIVMREASFKVLAPYVPVGEVYPCGW